MVFRTRYILKGGHVHVRVFVAPDPRQTFASIGTLVMSEADWAEFRDAFNAEHLEEPT